MILQVTTRKKETLLVTCCPTISSPISYELFVYHPTSNTLWTKTIRASDQPSRLLCTSVEYLGHVQKAFTASSPFQFEYENNGYIALYQDGNALFDAWSFCNVGSLAGKVWTRLWKTTSDEKEKSDMKMESVLYQNEQLRKENEKLKREWDIHLQQEDDTRNVLMTKMVKVLNTKKEKITQLRKENNSNNNENMDVYRNGSHCTIEDVMQEDSSDSDNSTQCSVVEEKSTRKESMEKKKIAELLADSDDEGPVKQARHK